MESLHPALITAHYLLKLRIVLHRFTVKSACMIPGNTKIANQVLVRQNHITDGNYECYMESNLRLLCASNVMCGRELAQARVRHITHTAL
jgi:hypothetical protein